MRGPHSRRHLELAGVSNVTVIGDPALSLTVDKPPVFCARPRLVINLTQEAGTPLCEGPYHAFQHVGRLAAEFARTGGEVLGVALGTGDRAVLNKIREEHRITSMIIEDHRFSADKLLERLSGSLGLIGVRLHSAVLASCVGVPSILFAYREKCREFMSSMEIEDFTLPLSSETSYEDIAEKWHGVTTNPGLSEKIYRKALFWKQTQQRHFRLVADHIMQTNG